MAKKNSGVALDQAAKSRQLTTIRRINKLLSAEGIAGNVRELHLDVPGVALNCPPGKRKKTVCRRNPDGSVTCWEECA